MLDTVIITKKAITKEKFEVNEGSQYPLLNVLTHNQGKEKLKLMSNPH